LRMGRPIKDRTGEKRMMNCGLEATITRCGGSLDIDVRFTDGQESHHRAYSSFKEGSIAPPNYTQMKNRIGEKRMMNCGLIAEITRYGRSDDIDIRFEDGQEEYHRQYAEFIKGKIAPPIDPRHPSHIGEKRMMNCGLIAEIFRYGNNQDIDVQFEDGQVVCHKRYYAFCRGMITHPGFNVRKIPSLYKPFITQYTERHPQIGEPYYHCKCQKCGFEIIDTARNIIKMEHNCESTN